PSSEFFTLSLHDALPIWVPDSLPSYDQSRFRWRAARGNFKNGRGHIAMRFHRMPFLFHQRDDALERERDGGLLELGQRVQRVGQDRKSTRLNSSHVKISY